MEFFMYAPAPVRTSVLEFIQKSMGSQFVIPVYQRNYTWKAKEEVDTFLYDVESLLRDESDAHFFGIIIYLDLPRTFYHHEYQLVDGQQRMTTVFLTLYALKHIAQQIDLNSTLPDALDDMYLINKHIEDASMKLKLKPLVSDDNVYVKIVENNLNGLSNDEKNTNVYKNYTAIKDRIGTWLLQNYSLEDILKALQKLYIVTIPLLNTDDPQQIFESINSKGAPLTSADLIRNYLLMGEDDAEQEKLYEKYWKPLEEKVSDSKELEEFFRMFLANQTYDLPQKRQVYNAFKLWCVEKNNKQDTFMKINQYMGYYWKLYRDADAEKHISALRFFRRNPSIMPAPFLLEIYRLYDGQKISIDVLNEIINLIDIYLIRRALVSRDTSEITRFFPFLLKRVVLATGEDFANLFENTKYFLVNDTKFTAMKMPTDQEIREFLSHNDAYILKCTRSVLEKIELVDNSAKVDLSNLTIEHLLPQTPTDFWKQYVPAEKYNDYVGLIGNLTLATNLNNIQMGNDEWNKKKQILNNTKHIKLNEEILNCDKWDVDAIEQRTNTMIDKIIHIYPYLESDLQESPLPKEVQKQYTQAKKARKLSRVSKDRFTFDLLEIPNGSMLVFIKDETETCKVVSENTVSYKGKEYSLSGLALELLHNRGIGWTRVQGPAMFKFNGEVLTDRRDRLESSR
jgi:uncharacterized protein with ParB-like and HNH nuclease domain